MEFLFVFVMLFLFAGLMLYYSPLLINYEGDKNLPWFANILVSEGSFKCLNVKQWSKSFDVVDPQLTPSSTLKIKKVVCLFATRDI